jgi:hypothetical protein
MFTSLQDKEVCDLRIILIPRVFLAGFLGVTMDSHLQMTESSE